MPGTVFSILRFPTFFYLKLTEEGIYLYHQLFNYLVIFAVNVRVDTYRDFFLIPGMIVIHKTGHTAAGTSTNGIKFKIPGSVFLTEQLSQVCIEWKPVCAWC